MVAERTEEEELVALLALDPPAMWRGIRAASASIYAQPTSRWTVRRLTLTLGTTITRRLVFAAERGTSQTAPIRRLWLRSIATACAARIEAESSAIMPPDEAYLFGLASSLPVWLAMLHKLRTGGANEPDPQVWTKRWNLTPELAAASGIGDPADCSKDILDLLRRATQTAEQAGYLLEPGHLPSRGGVSLEHGSEAAQRATKVRLEVNERMVKVGLDFARADEEIHEARRSKRTLSAPSAAGRNSSDEFILSLLGHSEASTYCEVITALTSAGVLHGGFDRAFFGRWCAAEGAVVLRAKDDQSSREIARPKISPTESEAFAMRTALSEDRPLRIERLEENGGVLEALGLDEALIVPFNRKLLSPSFLWLDRSLSLEPIRLALDGARTLATGLAGTLLIENLLLRKRSQRAHKFAQTDGLTHLFNRATGMRILEQELARAHREGSPVAVLLCDLDHFKALNDSLGHLAGDQALRVVADTLRKTVRLSDNISRFGGEEFLVVLPSTQSSDASVLAARVFTAIADRGKELRIPLTISIGLAMARSDDTMESLLQRADLALYASKGHGRNRFATDGGDDLTPPLSPPETVPVPSGPTSPDED